MVEKARTDCWDDVITLESERRILLEQYFANDVKLKDDVAAVQVGIQTIRDLDQQLVGLGQKKKKELASAIRDFGLGKKAVKAYSN